MSDKVEARFQLLASLSEVVTFFFTSYRQADEDWRILDKAPVLLLPLSSHLQEPQIRSAMYSNFTPSKIAHT